MLANGFVNRELFAAFRLLEDCSDFSDLQHQWRETNRQALGTLFRRDREKKSCCGGAQPKAFGGLSRMSPVLSVENSTTSSYSYSLPFVYLAWRVRDRIFPCIEVVEFPIGNSFGNAISETEFRESGRTGIRCVRMLRDMTQKEFAETTERGLFSSPLPHWIEEARRAVVLEVFDENELFPLVYFSRCEFRPQSVSEQNYLRSCELAEERLDWDFHMERVLFHPDRGMKTPVRMKTFAVRRGEALSF
jgi:hypothetical protein